MRNLLIDILEGKPVRETIDAYVLEADASIDLGDEDLNAEDSDSVDSQFAADEDESYTHLFVRWFRKGADAPYKRAKCDSANQALTLFFDYVGQHKSDRVEIWSDVAADATSFYRYVIKNREQVGDAWKSSGCAKRAGLLWPSAYHSVVQRAKLHGIDVVGVLSPFEVNAK